MKQFCSFSLVVLLTALITGCEPNDQTGKGTDHTQASNQNAQSQLSQDTLGSKRSVDLKQRTGIPFQVRQAARDTLPLLAIMANLEQNMAVVQAGIWRGNYQAINKAAKAMVNHAKIPKKEIRKIRSILGKQGLKGFVAADKVWHNKAKELAQVANEKKMERIVNKTMELLQRCASCHMKYRAPLRNSPKWLAR